MQILLTRIACLAICLCAMCMPLGLMAQTDTDLRNHVIISFDNALSIYENALRGQKANVTKQMVKRLHEADALNKGDYVTLVNYVAGTGNRNVHDFTTVITDRYNEPVAWREYDNINELFDGNWESMVLEQGKNKVKGEPYSLQTVCRQFSLLAAGPWVAQSGLTDGKYANKTYLLLVTDDRYNGLDDIYKEVEGYAKMGGQIPQHDLTGGSELVTDNYLFRHIGEDTYLPGGVVKLMLYEVVPAYRIALSGALDYPANLNLKRVRGGYRASFDVTSADPENYELMKFELQAAGQKPIVAKIDKDTPGLCHIDAFIPSKAAKHDSLSLTLRGWVRLNDDAYGMAVPSPYDPNHQSLQVTRTVKAPAGASILGLKMPDFLWWWFPNNAGLAAGIWVAIVIILIVGFALWVVVRYIKQHQIYVPLDSDISIQIEPLQMQRRPQRDPGRKPNSKKTRN